jgi:hypothetical protein
MLVPTSPDITPTYIYNPLKEDFTTTYAEERTPVEYTVHSKELATFPRWLANHIGNKIVQKLALMEDQGISWDIREAEARKKVFVTI